MAEPPTSSSDVDRRLPRPLLERRKHALAITLAERSQPHPGGYQIGGDGV
jgi:hypothetical protein